MSRLDRHHFIKIDPEAPAGFYEAEAVSLKWLAQAPQGATVVRMIDVSPGKITLQRVPSVPASRNAARAFGEGLAHTHSAGASHYGAPPPDWDGDGFIGRLALSYNRTAPHLAFGDFYAEYRIKPYAQMLHAAGGLSDADLNAIHKLCDVMSEDVELVGPAEPPSRIHGDLWVGNMVWTASEAVLIDPAAHGGHRETDLAMLQLFGAPFFADILDSYNKVHPLAVGWKDRVALHQLHPLLVHAVLFGGDYAAQAMDIVYLYL